MDMSGASVQRNPKLIIPTCTCSPDNPGMLIGEPESLPQADEPHVRESVHICFDASSASAAQQLLTPDILLRKTKFLH